MKAIPNDSRRCSEIDRSVRRHLVSAALLVVAALVSACDGAALPTTADADHPTEAVASETGAGGRHAEPDATDAGRGTDTPIDGPVAPPNPPPSPGLALGLACLDDADCATGHCVDGVCCDSPCTGSCQSCALTGKVGTCAPVRSATDDACTGASVCDPSGVCRKDLGQTCTRSPDCASGSCVDGVCCGSASCGTCQSCALPGSLGSCVPVPRLTEDSDSGCSGDRACNGVGDCRAKVGQTCAAATDCVSQQCADGICCESACTATCYSCNQPGKLGTCAPLDAAQDLEATMACAGSAFCIAAQDAAPVCKVRFADGSPCITALDCLSGVCASYYQDLDGDGYGGTFVRACGTPPAGAASRGGDCCDSSATTHPGVTVFSSRANTCGNFDFNCDGVAELEIGATSACGERSAVSLGFSGCR